MKVGVIGLGAMGGGIAQNLIEKGFSVVARDARAEIVDRFTKKGATAAGKRGEFESLVGFWEELTGTFFSKNAL